MKIFGLIFGSLTVIVSLWLAIGYGSCASVDSVKSNRDKINALEKSTCEKIERNHERLNRMEPEIKKIDSLEKMQNLDRSRLERIEDGIKDLNTDVKILLQRIPEKRGGD